MSQKPKFVKLKDGVRINLDLVVLAMVQRNYGNDEFRICFLFTESSKHTLEGFESLEEAEKYLTRVLEGNVSHL